MSDRIDGIKWVPRIQVAKYSPEQVRELTAFLGYEPTAHDFNNLAVEPSDYSFAVGNDLTDAGLTRITSLLTGGGGQALTQAASRIGVGDGTATFDGSQTALQGANQYYQTVTSVNNAVGQVTVVATFGTNTANFAWEEWCWDIDSTPPAASSATVSDLMLNRKVTPMGTKASGASWVFTTTVTLQ
jgi:hypothetical protein